MRHVPRARSAKLHLPTILVIFGATGDLARRKLFPALFNLYEKNLLPSSLSVVGFSRRELSNSGFREYIVDVLGSRAGKKRAAEFASRFFYTRGLFDQRKGYEKLAALLGKQDEEWRTCANKFFYLAVPPKHYRGIFTHLAASGLTKPCSPEEGWTRVLVEKPFGKNLKTAEELDALLGRLFREEQVYRIDHYLGKETVQNILAFRFSNSFLEPAWNRNTIEHVHVRILEREGVEDHGEFYDGVGALRDVGQNHLLQLLALFTMEKPGAFEADSIRAARSAILESLRILSRADVQSSTRRGQYYGYRKESGVARASNTETYFRIRAELDHPRWKGVPITLEAGKHARAARADVTVTFAHDTPCLCPPRRRRHFKNVLRYHIQPREGINVSFWIKKPGGKLTLEEKEFSFDYRKAYPGERADAYERLLLDALHGNQTLFVSTKEIVASWRFIDPILIAWKRGISPLISYSRAARSALEKPLPIETEHAALRKEIGFIGLGKMGRNMGMRLLERGWRVRAYDPSEEARGALKGTQARTARSPREMISALTRPRIVWLMVPAGNAVDDVLFGKEGIIKSLRRGDIVIDGGNSFYKDSTRRAQTLSRHGIQFLDVGVSGGPDGARHGACFMVGGRKELAETLDPLFRDLAVRNGYLHVGKSGAGHFVKMIHNGIEYGMMQAFGEGFAILKKSPFALDLQNIAELYNHGSVIESRLAGWLAEAFREYGDELSGISGIVGHTGEGEWTAKAARDLKVPAPIIEKSFQFRIASKRKPSYIGKILSALRNQFGGHNVKIR